MPSDRVGPRAVFDRIQSGEALLVCSYEDEEKFHDNELAGAISLQEFRRRLDDIPRERELVFYCA